MNQRMEEKTKQLSTINTITEGFSLTAERPTLQQFSLILKNLNNLSHLTIKTPQISDIVITKYVCEAIMSSCCILESLEILVDTDDYYEYPDGWEGHVGAIPIAISSKWPNLQRFKMGLSGRQETTTDLHLQSDSNKLLEGHLY